MRAARINCVIPSQFKGTSLEEQYHVALYDLDYPEGSSSLYTQENGYRLLQGLICSKSLNWFEQLKGKELLTQDNLNEIFSYPFNVLQNILSHIAGMPFVKVQSDLSASIAKIMPFSKCQADLNAIIAKMATREFGASMERAGAELDSAKIPQLAARRVDLMKAVEGARDAKQLNDLRQVLLLLVSLSDVGVRTGFAQHAAKYISPSIIYKLLDKANEISAQINPIPLSDAAIADPTITDTVKILITLSGSDAARVLNRDLLHLTTSFLTSTILLREETKSILSLDKQINESIFPIRKRAILNDLTNFYGRSCADTSRFGFFKVDIALENFGNKCKDAKSTPDLCKIIDEELTKTNDPTLKDILKQHKALR